jgi:hypothetical protein
VENEVKGAFRLLGDRELDPGVRARADPLEADVVDAARSGPWLSVLARRSRTVLSAQRERSALTLVGWRRSGSPAEVLKMFTRTSSGATESIGAEGATRSIRYC